MKKWIVALGITSLMLPSAALADCTRVGDFSTACSDYQDDIRISGNNIYLNSDQPDSIYYATTINTFRHYPYSRHAYRSWYWHRNRHSTDDHWYFINRSRNSHWEYYPYWQQQEKIKYSTTVQLIPYWDYAPSDKPVDRRHHNIYLQRK